MDALALATAIADCACVATQAVLGILLLLAELEIEMLRAYVHILSYRSGRAAIALMIGTICVSAAPSELPVSTVNQGSSGNYVVEYKWEYCFVGLFVIAGAAQNIRLTVRSKVHKLQHGRNKLGDVKGKPHDLV